MLMTEQEAREKWCPATGTRASTARCLGSGCMAWRQGPDPDCYPNRITCENPDAKVEPERPAHVPAAYEFSPFDGGFASAEWVEPQASVERRRAELKGRGFCGLAGAPTYE